MSLHDKIADLERALTEKQKADFRAVFLEHPRGPAVLETILGWCHEGEDIFTGNSLTYVLCGERRIGILVKQALGLGGVRGSLERHLLIDPRDKILAEAVNKLQEEIDNV